MIKKLLHIFAMSNLFNRVVNHLDFTNNYIGVVSLNSFCYALSGFDNLEGATLSFYKCKLFSNVKPRKQFTAGTQGAPICNVLLTKRAKSTCLTLQNIQRFWQQMVCYRHIQKRLFSKIPHFKQIILFSQGKNPTRCNALAFTKTNGLP